MLMATIFPHLKKCGPIEAAAVQGVVRQIGKFPHLKKCGPIEASIDRRWKNTLSEISALEKVRPH